ncbi:MAG: hypothetical protein ACJ72D_24565 [Marmoricola sp.]
MMQVDFYRAENEYRREAIRREFRPFFGRRAAKAASRNQIAADGGAGLGA